MSFVVMRRDKSSSPIEHLVFHFFLPFALEINIITLSASICVVERKNERQTKSNRYALNVGA